MQQLMSEQDFCRKAIIETSEILRDVAIFSTLNSTQLYQ